MFDAEQKLIVCNRTYVDMYNLTPALARPGTLLQAIESYRTTIGNGAIANPEQVASAAIQTREASAFTQELTDGRTIAVSQRPMQDGGWVAVHEDITERRRAEAKIAHLARHDMFGRSPDHVASFVTGMAMKPDALPAPHGFGDNVLKYYRHIRDNDTYVVYAVLPPQAARDPQFYIKKNIPVPSLRVVREDDDGVVISGMKMLATGALYANEIWIGNVIPLAPDQKKEAITCAIPCNAPGLTLWSRKPAALGLSSEFDSPLAWRYDESDSMIVRQARLRTSGSGH